MQVFHAGYQFVYRERGSEFDEFASCYSLFETDSVYNMGKERLALCLPIPEDIVVGEQRIVNERFNTPLLSCNVFEVAATLGSRHTQRENVK